MPLHYIWAMMPKMSVSLYVTKITNGYLFMFVLCILVYSFSLACFSSFCHVSLSPATHQLFSLNSTSRGYCSSTLNELLIFVFLFQREQYRNNRLGWYSIGKMLAREYASVIRFQYHFAEKSLCSLLYKRIFLAKCTYSFWW